MTSEEVQVCAHMAAYYALKPTIEADYPPKQFVAIHGGKIVADDADFKKLQEKLGALGIGRMDALIDRAGDPIPCQRAFPGMTAVAAMGRRSGVPIPVSGRDATGLDESRLPRPDGTIHSFDLVVDTGCDDAIVLRKSAFDLVTHGVAPSYFSSWGLMQGGWLDIDMPACGLAARVHGYADYQLSAGVAASDPNFMGLVGLPLLRFGEFGGNATDFWFRYPPS